MFAGEGQELEEEEEGVFQAQAKGSSSSPELGEGFGVQRGETQRNRDLAPLRMVCKVSPLAPPTAWDRPLL